MPKPFKLPEKLAFDTLKGDEFTQIKTAARLSGIHPEILAAGRRLLANPTQGFVFKLATPQMIEHGDAIESIFVKGLRKVSKAFGGGKAKSLLDREKQRIVFWYETK
jgi:hypothetical protein